MPRNRVKKEHNKGIYFVTPTIWNYRNIGAGLLLIGIQKIEVVALI